MMNEDLQFRRRIQGVMRKYAREGDRFIGGCCNVCRGGACGGNFYQGGVSVDVWEQLGEEDREGLKKAQAIALRLLGADDVTGPITAVLRRVADYARLDVHMLQKSLEQLANYMVRTYAPGRSSGPVREKAMRLGEAVGELAVSVRQIIDSGYGADDIDSASYRVFKEDDGSFVEDGDVFDNRVFPAESYDIVGITEQYIRDMEEYIVRRRNVSSTSGTSEDGTQLLETAKDAIQQHQQASANDDESTQALAEQALQTTADKAEQNVADAQADVALIELSGPKPGESEDEYFARLDNADENVRDATNVAQAIETMVDAVADGVTRKVAITRPQLTITRMARVPEIFVEEDDLPPIPPKPRGRSRRHLLPPVEDIFVDKPELPPRPPRREMTSPPPRPRGRKAAKYDPVKVCEENWEDLGLESKEKCSEILSNLPRASRTKSKASIEDSAMSKRLGTTWVGHVKAYAKKHNVTYSAAMSLAGPSWRGCKVARPCPARKKVCKKTPCATKKPSQRWAKPAATKKRAASGSKTAAKRRTAKKKAPARKKRGGGMVQ